VCRFLAYKGQPLLMDELIYKPKNSLIKQSAMAHESEEPLNGDGFGIGWYDKRLDADPGLFVSVRPAWNDRNLRSIAKKIMSPCIFAHVRAASMGDVSESNCHPFHFKHFMFMHNGGIGGFHHIKRFVRRLLSDEIYDWIRGQTDSEHLFALFLENMRRKKVHRNSSEIMAEVLVATIKQIEKIKTVHKIRETSYINVCISDGDHIVAIRYVSNKREKAPTLYYSVGGKYVCKKGVCHLETPSSPKDNSILIVSEKLTANVEDWNQIPENHLLIVRNDLSVDLRPVKL
jgi:glutamine amidotransferase